MSATVTVRERPILFSGAMVRAILDGSKTQTRRVVRPQPSDGQPWPHDRSHIEWDDVVERTAYYAACGHCPYGQPGDCRLWVRETHVLQLDRVVYRADRAASYWADTHSGAPELAGNIYWLPSDYEPERWRPSIHMPRWASRITLELTDVRVERVQDISDADAIAEGFSDVDTPAPARMSAAVAFSETWDSLNEARGYGWDVNPWVWVLSFRWVQP